MSPELFSSNSMNCSVRKRGTSCTLHGYVQLPSISSCVTWFSESNLKNTCTVCLAHISMTFEQTGYTLLLVGVARAFGTVGHCNKVWDGWQSVRWKSSRKWPTFQQTEVGAIPHQRKTRSARLVASHWSTRQLWFRLISLVSLRKCPLTLIRCQSLFQIFNIVPIPTSQVALQQWWKLLEHNTITWK